MLPTTDDLPLIYSGSGYKMGHPEAKAKKSFLTCFKSLLTTRFNITRNYFKSSSEPKSTEKYRTEFVTLGCSEQIPRAQQSTKPGRNHHHPLTVQFNSQMGLYFRHAKLFISRKIFLFLSQYHLQNYLIDSWRSKMSRLSTFMLKLITFAFKKNHE